MKKSILSCALVSAFLFAGSANAGVVTYNITDILGGTAYTAPNAGQTYAGTGFVGMYSNNQFAHLFGLEGSSSRTNMEVGIGALAGKNVSSATLSFVLAENYVTDGLLTITGYNANGALGYAFNAPAAAYGTVTGNLANGMGATSTFDVTALTQAALAHGEDWLGLQLTNSTASRWTYTGFSSFSPDRAQVRLVVTYADANVPEPASLALVGLGLLGLGVVRKKKNQ